MNHYFEGSRHRRRTRPRHAGMLAAVAGLVLLATACGAPSSASSSTGASSSASAGSGGSSSGGGPSDSQQLAYSQCMRSHGVADFPDPQVGGGFAAAGRQAQNDPNFQTADNTCRSLLGSGAGNKGQQNVSQFLRHAQCMRSHGVPNYPDPQPGVNPRTAMQQAGINVNSPQFNSAAQACDRLLPQPGASSSPGGTS